MVRTRARQNPGVQDSRRRRARVSMVAVFSLFLLPLALAVWMYQGNWRPQQTGNHGELITPPLQAGAMPLEAQDGSSMGDDWLANGHWTLVLRQPGQCEESCQRSLLNSRQVRLALGKERPRVRRLLLIDAPLLAPISELHPDLIVARPLAQNPFGSDASLWVVDPLGNAMLRFPDGFEAKGLFEDLRHLLKLSRIG